MVVVGRVWLPSLFIVVSGGEHSAVEGAEVRLGRFGLLYLLLPNFKMFRLYFGCDSVVCGGFHLILCYCF